MRFIFLSFVLLLFINLLLFTYSDVLITYLSNKYTDISKEALKKDLDYLYNNPKIKYHLLLRPKSYIKIKYTTTRNNNDEANLNLNLNLSDDISKLISFDEFYHQFDTDTIFNEIVYNSIYYITNLQANIAIQFIRLVFMIGYFVTFFFFLRLFQFGLIKIFGIMIVFVLIISTNLFLVKYFSPDIIKEKEENDGLKIVEIDKK